MPTTNSIKDEKFAVLFQSQCSCRFRSYGEDGDTIDQKGGKQDREENRLKLYILQEKGSILNSAFVLAYAGHQLVLNSCISTAPASFHKVRKDTVVLRLEILCIIQG